MQQKSTSRPLDLGTILGPMRLFDGGRLLGPAPIDNVVRHDLTVSPSTFNRIRAHSDPGCCARHDVIRRDKKRRLDS